MSVMSAVGPEENNILFTAPKDKYYKANSGKQFTLRQLKNAARDSKNLSGCLKELGLVSSGDINDYVRWLIQNHIVRTSHWKNPLIPFNRGKDALPIKWEAYWPKQKRLVLPRQTNVDIQKLERSARLFLEAIGEDPDRDGLKDTPKRYANYQADIMNGHFKQVKNYLREFDNDEGYDGPVVVTDMPFYTICEHHLAPFIGTWDFAYKPADKILGLSKIVRIARVYQKRPQVQERLTQQIAKTMWEVLKPKWVVVRMSAEHFCMSTRGVRTPGSQTVTRKSCCRTGIQRPDEILPINV